MGKRIAGEGTAPGKHKMESRSTHPTFLYSYSGVMRAGIAYATPLFLIVSAQDPLAAADRQAPTVFPRSLV
jgi:hypothetical protein